MSEFTSEGSQAADEEVKHVQAEPELDPTTPSGLPDTSSRPDPAAPATAETDAGDEQDPTEQTGA